jgi:hypothetical protein
VKDIGEVLRRKEAEAEVLRHEIEVLIEAEALLREDQDKPIALVPQSPAGFP